MNIRSIPCSPVILYGSPRSSCAWRVRIALHLKKIPFEERTVTSETLQSKEFKQLNPQGKILVLLIDGKVLSQSLAIMDYLDQTRPKSLPLFPKDLDLRYEALNQALIIAADTQPHQGLSTLDRLPESKRTEEAQYWIEKGLKALEEQVEKTSQGFCVGDTVSCADLFLVPQLQNARLFDVDLSLYPTLLGIEAKLEKMDAFIQAKPRLPSPDKVPT